MAIARATVRLLPLSAEPIDASVNVWHFATQDLVNADDRLKIADGLVAFYRAIGSQLSAVIRRNSIVHEIELAQVTQNAPGEADDVVSKVLGTRLFDIATAPAGSLSMPGEVAIALSFRGDVTGIPEESADGLTRPAARRRGRVYLGPLNNNALATEPVSGRPHVATPTQVQIASTAYTAALDVWKAGVRPVQHIVYSRASALVHQVVEVHVDDAFDTIRSRGEKPVNRSSYPVAQGTFV